MIIGLCDRWHKLPEEIMSMDASAVGLLEIVRRGRRERPDAE